MATITIRSRAPATLSLLVPGDDPGTATTFALNGERGGAPGREGLTDGVDADLFQRWSKANPDHPALVGGLLEVVEADEGAVDGDDNHAGLVADLRAELAALQAKNDDLVQSGITAVAACDAARAETATVSAERDAAKAEVERLTAELAATKADLEAAHALMAEATTAPASETTPPAEPPADALPEAGSDAAPRRARRNASE